MVLLKGGGAIFINAGVVATIIHCTFEKNTALQAGEGGAIYAVILQIGKLDVSNCIFINNTAQKTVRIIR